MPYTYIMFLLEMPRLIFALRTFSRIEIGREREKISPNLIWSEKGGWKPLKERLARKREHTFHMYVYFIAYSYCIHLYTFKSTSTNTGEDQLKGEGLLCWGIHNSKYSFSSYLIILILLIIIITTITRIQYFSPIVT